MDMYKPRKDAHDPNAPDPHHNYKPKTPIPPEVPVTKSKNNNVVTGEGMSGRTRGKKAKLLAIYFAWYITPTHLRDDDEKDLFSFCRKYRVTRSALQKWRQSPEWVEMLKRQHTQTIELRTQEIIDNLYEIAMTTDAKATQAIKLWLDYIARITPKAEDDANTAKAQLATAIVDAIEEIRATKSIRDQVDDDEPKEN